MPDGWTGGKIPSKIGGTKVTSIGDNAFSNKTGITEVVIPEGVTSIGDSAFSNSGLTYVKLPKTLNSIGDYAFRGCSSLTDKLVIPEGVTSIGKGAFSGCHQLEAVGIPSTMQSIGEYAFQTCDHVKEVSFAGKMSDITFGKQAFVNTLWMHPNFSTPYRSSEYYQKFQSLDLSNTDYAADAIKIAESQDGYHEGNNFSQMDGSNPKGNDDFAEMAYFSSSPSYRWLPYEEEYDYGGWCGNFCWWALGMASIPQDAHDYWLKDRDNCLKWKDTRYSGETGINYELKAGDLLNMEIGHWCMVTDVEVLENGNVKVGTWNGNNDNNVGFDYNVFRASDGYNLTMAEEYNREGGQDYGEKYRPKGIYAYHPEYLAGIKFYNVYFDVNEGESLPSGKEVKKVADDSYFGWMPVPKRDGWIFDGWYTQPETDYGVKVTSYRRTRINRDIRLYAHWRTADEEEEEPDGVPGPGIPKGSEENPVNPDPAPEGEVGTREKDYEIDENGIITKSAYQVANAKIPSVINGVTVRGIKQYAFGTRSSLYSAEIPDTCLSIDTYAFWNCQKLKNLVIGNGVSVIGKYAFGIQRGSTGALEKVTIGSGIRSIAQYAFWNQNTLKEVVIRAEEGTVDIEKGAFPDGVVIKYEKTEGGGPSADPAEEGDNTGFTVCFNDASLTKRTVDGKERYETVYTGAAVRPALLVKHNGKTLAEGTDYTVKYVKNLNVSEAGAEASVTGKGSFSGTETLKFYILPKKIADTDIEVGNLVIKEGQAVKPVLSCRGVFLKEKTDYTLESGDGNVTIKACEKNYTESRTENVTVLTAEAYNKSAIRVTLQIPRTSPKVYDGKPKELSQSELLVKNAAGDTLEKDKDYAVTYSSNINAGTVKVTVIGKGSWRGKVVKTFPIKPNKNAEIKVMKDRVSYTYVKTGVKPKLTVLATVSDGSVPLTEGKDYKVSYSGNKTVGTKAKFSLTFLGNYRGAKYKGANTFEIKKVQTSSANTIVIAKDMLYAKKAKYQPKPYVIVNGSLLAASDYAVAWAVTDKLELGENETKKCSLTVNAKGARYENATGTNGLDASYSVISGTDRKDISKAKVSFMDGNRKKTSMGYTGHRIVFSSADTENPQINVKLGSDVNLTGADVEKYFEIRYADNLEKGKATVILTAKADSPYIGTCVGTFSIVSRKVGK